MEGLGLAGWTFSEQSIRKALMAEILLNPSLDLGNPCNLNCPYCFVEEKNSLRKVRRKEELRYEEIRNVVADFLASGAETVNLVGAGEPTIDPQFKEVVEQVWSGGARVVLFTNGVALANPQIVEFLWNCGVTVVLKYNSRLSSVQDAVVGKIGYTKERDRALRLLLEVGFNSPGLTRLGFDTLAFEGNLEELPAIHRWCRENNVYPLTAEFIPAGRTEDGTVEAAASLNQLDPNLASIAKRALRPLDAEQRERLRSAIEEVDRELGLWHFGPKAYFGGGVCTQLLGVYVDIEGRIWPCVARSYSNSRARVPLGWIRRGDRASEIWRTARYLREVRENYTGACPYKPSLEPMITKEGAVAAVSSAILTDGLPLSTSSDEGLVQIGHKYRTAKL